MDQNTLIALVIFAVVFLVAIVVLRSKTTFRGKVTGPLGLGVEAEAGDPPVTHRGATVEGSKAGGSISAVDKTAVGATVKDSQAGGDITATSSVPGEQDPKG